MARRAAVRAPKCKTCSRTTAPAKSALEGWWEEAPIPDPTNPRRRPNRHLREGRRRLRSGEESPPGKKVVAKNDLGR